MKEKEFKGRIASIQKLIEQSKGPRNTYIEKINELKKNLDEVIVNLDERDEKFTRYLNDISNLSFADDLIAPTDIFQGIRTANQAADYEELEKTGERMKSGADEITNHAAVASSAMRTSMNAIKSGSVALSQLAELKNQIYDLELKLLKDMDSIYDIGNLSNEEATQWLAKNT